MARGRGSAMVFLSLFILLHCQTMVQAATYVVGGSGGWTFNVATWPKGKNFKAGDTLVFNYPASAHNVVSVNKAGYKSCAATPKGATVFTSGKDKIKLVKGQNFFICSLSGHCQSGMKLAITAV